MGRCRRRCRRRRCRRRRRRRRRRCHRRRRRRRHCRRFVVVVVVVVDKFLILFMTSSPHPFRTDRQNFKMAASVDENSKWSSVVMKYKMAADDDEIPGHVVRSGVKGDLPHIGVIMTRTYYLYCILFDLEHLLYYILHAV